MYELIQLSDNDFLVDCPSKMGIVRTGGNSVVMIDAGSDKDAAKKALRHITEKGWELKAVYNTHSHADHIGGNRFLQERTGCSIYAKGMERVLAENPILEPVCLYGGIPAKELRNKFFLAKESHVQELTEETLPEGFRVIPLPGHTCDQVGYLTPDGTFFAGDALLSEETLGKYAISYIYDVESYLKTLEGLQEIPAERFVPSHTPVVKDIGPLAEKNLDSVREVAVRILTFCEDPCTHDTLMKRIFTAYGIQMSISQYCLIGTTVKSYLLWMREEGKVTTEICGNEILWKKLSAKACL